MLEIVSPIISAVATIVCCVITGLFAKDKKHEQENDKKVEERAKQRAEEGRLQLRMINANSKLTIGVAMALKNGHCNGEVEEGLRLVQEADDAYRTFLEEIAIGRIK